jgi:hypothetical protein
VNGLLSPSVLSELTALYLRREPSLLRLPSPHPVLSELLGEKLDELLWLYSLHFPTKTRLFRASSERTAPAENARQRYVGLASALRSGFTVILNEIERVSPACAQTCASMARLLGARISANLYLSPDHAFGFAEHTDDHDVFVIQLDGQKTWTVARGDEAKQQILTINPGDILYIPRDTYHQARTIDYHSVHVTVGIHPVTLPDVISRLFDSLPQSVTGLYLDHLKHENADVLDEILLEQARKVLDRQDAFRTAVTEAIAERSQLNVAPEPGMVQQQLNHRTANRDSTFSLAPGISVKVARRDENRWVASFVRESGSTNAIDVLTTEIRARAISSLVDSGAALGLASSPPAFTDSEWEILLEFLLANGLVIPRGD